MSPEQLTTLFFGFAQCSIGKREREDSRDYALVWDLGTKFRLELDLICVSEMWSTMCVYL